MLTVQQNQPNLCHVFQLVRVADRVTLDFVKVEQACARRDARRNCYRCQQQLQGRVGDGLEYQHLLTGTPEEAEMLMCTLRASYPGLG